MPGSIQQHTLVYTIVIAMALTIFLDLTRIASIGAILYIVMDMAVHWGVWRHLRREIDASGAILLIALALDALVLAALLVVKASSDMLVVVISGVALLLVFAGENFFLRNFTRS